MNRKIRKIENYTELFSKKVNVNFVKVIDRNNMEVITWSSMRLCKLLDFVNRYTTIFA